MRLVDVEGTHSHGAGITVHLKDAGIRVVKVIRPNRQVQRLRGKSVPIDAYEGAAAALGTNDRPERPQETS